MKRILIIGPCGAGKSTLAVALGTRFENPAALDKWLRLTPQTGKSKIKPQQ